MFSCYNNFYCIYTDDLEHIILKLKEPAVGRLLTTMATQKNSELVMKRNPKFGTSQELKQRNADNCNKIVVCTFNYFTLNILAKVLKNNKQKNSILQHRTLKIYSALNM